MLKKEITYVDYFGEERTEDFYFNLNETELSELMFEFDGGLDKWIETIVKSRNGKQIMATFRMIIFKAYGERSNDGRRFMKSEELSKAFSETEAYNKLFMELCTNADAAANFVNCIVPSDIAKAINTVNENSDK